MTEGPDDITIPKHLEGLFRHMPAMTDYRDDLRSLGTQWDLLTILGQMSGTGMDMTATRQGFQKLTSALLVQLGLETLNKTVREIGGKAQVAVDIVIRNLFERTADIGFLATDDDIRAFLKTAKTIDGKIARLQKSGEGTGALSKEREDRTATLISRFKEYVAKYSVYSDIILLSPSGEILARLDAGNTAPRSTDPLIREALSTRGEYVEIFRHTDLFPSREKSLLYAFRVTEGNAPNAEILGVLCLCFRFEDEMAGVFRNLASRNDWSVLTLLDGQGGVIASSNAGQIPLGSVMDMAPGADFKIIRSGGREYLSKTCATKGYQGYAGPGWYGHAMVPIEHAFEQEYSGDLKAQVGQTVLDAVMGDPRLFSEALRSIPTQAEEIQQELERTVWNGNVRERNTQAKVLLWNISEAGAKTQQIFEKSIGNLHETVVGAILNDVALQAALAVDIMDRNLYERANDCRWWAQTSTFRRLLSSPSVSDSDTAVISSILAHIHGLYTVYSNLFVFNAAGEILAVSKPTEAHHVGSILTEAWTRGTLSLRTSQDYCVSPFEPTPLYDGNPTYIYSAPIHAPGRSGSCVGGVGIVFDSRPQFRGMLMDALPQGEKEGQGGCFAVFADKTGRIISASDDRFAIGETIDVPPDFLNHAPGEGTSGIIAHQGQYYAVGSRTSAGYREYKVEDDYVNEIVGMVFVPLAEAPARVSKHHRPERGSEWSGARSGEAACLELATFYIGDRWFGICTDKIREAVKSAGITRLPGSSPIKVGTILYDNRTIPVLDLCAAMAIPRSSATPPSSIVLVDMGQSCIGILAEALGEVLEASLDQVDAAPPFLCGAGGYVDCIVKPRSNGTPLLMVLDPIRMASTIGGAHPV